MTSEISAAARTASGYGEASSLRQAPDMWWVLDSVSPETRSLLDLGCGTGALLAAALEHVPALQRVVGMDLSPARISEAEQNLAAHSQQADFLVSDLRTPPSMEEKFDTVTLTAVLHWLYPDEEQIFSWISERLHSAGGTLLLTTYHPVVGADGLGGTDLVVAEALSLLGVGDAAAAFAAAGVLPLGVRCRSVTALAELLDRYFRLEAEGERPAIVRISDPEQYQKFHAATFGTYYSRIAGEARQDDFFEALGSVAANRMRHQDYVTHMPVRLWRLSR